MKRSVWDIRLNCVRVQRVCMLSHTQRVERERETNECMFSQLSLSQTRTMFHCICGRAYSLPLVCDFKETLRQRGVESEEMKATCTRRLSLTSRLCCVIDTHTRKWTITQIQHVSVECMWSVGTAFRTNECVREITQPVARMLNEVWTKNRLQR